MHSTTPTSNQEGKEEAKPLKASSQLLMPSNVHYKQTTLLSLPNGLFACSINFDRATEHRSITQLWSASTPTAPLCIATLSEMKEANALVALPQGILAIGASQIYLWDYKKMENVGVISEGIDGLSSMLALSQGLLAVATGWGAMRVWNPTEFSTPVASFQSSHNSSGGIIKSMVELPGKRLALLHDSGDINIADIETRSLIPFQREPATDCSRSKLILLPNGNIICANNKAEIEIFDFTSNKPPVIPLAPKEVPYCFIRAFDLLPNGNILMSYKTSDGVNSVGVFDTKNYQWIWQKNILDGLFADYFAQYTILPTSHIIAVHALGNISLIDPTNGHFQIIGTLATLSNNGVATLSDGTVVVGGEGTFYFYDISCVQTYLSTLDASLICTTRLPNSLLNIIKGYAGADECPDRFFSQPKAYIKPIVEEEKTETIPSGMAPHKADIKYRRI